MKENHKLRIGLVGNPTKPELENVLTRYIGWLEQQGVNFVMSDDFENIPSLSKYKKIPADKMGQNADVLLSFGGDGTLLNTVGLLAGRETPVVGVNMGGLGYMTAAGPEDLDELTQALLTGKWEVEKRMVLKATIEDCPAGGVWYALNDVVIDKGGYSRMINLHATIGDEFLNDFRGDGIIISTPTGSTGYNLSAGGPIMEPDTEGILFTPLNPHSLSNRPLIISPEKTVCVVSQSELGYVNINVDGQEACKLANGKKLTVKKTDFIAPFVFFKQHYFYKVLRQKLRWGDENHQNQ